MGQHRDNPRAIEASKPAPRYPPGTEGYAADFETAVELNAAKKAEMVAILDAAKAEGRDPRLAIPKWNREENPDFYDFVVYFRGILIRPSPLAIDPRKIPAARVRLGEAYRIPYQEFRDRADLVFANHESRGAGH